MTDWTAKTRNIATTLFFAFLTFVVADFYFRNRVSLITTLTETSKAAVEVRKASTEVSLAAVEQRAFLKRQQDLFEAPQTQRSIGLALRTGDDLNRTVKKLNRTLDLFNDRTLLTINDRILPNAADLLASGDSMIRTTALVVQADGNALRLLAEEGTLTVRQLGTLLSSPSVVAFLAESAEAAKEAKLTAKEVREAIPELLVELHKIEQEVARGAGELATYIAGFNAPSSKTGKVLRFILGVLLSNARSLRP